VNWEAFTPYSALLGGALIGLATGLALLLNGKIAGISGVVARILRPAAGDAAWRVWFVFGLVAGGAATFAAHPPSATLVLAADSLPVMILAGFLVGLGTRVGGGCTSGHGVCGISRGSTGGIAATITFMVVGALVVYAYRHLGGAA
jgi:uncharacterized protein